MGMRKLRDKVSTPATILGKDFTINGDVKGSGTIVVSGNVKGNGEIDGLVELVSTGVWEGNIHTDDIVVGGTVKGDVFARGKLEITGSARIFGNVSGSMDAVDAIATTPTARGDRPLEDCVIESITITES